ncbi:CRISPR-associated endoribonuclease Cas6 [Paraflavitalea speifideaquila]|uniref:CRISPR-associated endoribonuclease Cas6 n=1 Tax=Paraflavitalea speifideaquila TaxID=3076558 RepID=UPI0028E45FA2|nr:CRISPR-associated endoribonuclease Cas6 [Paraflavitalea speifideiaquila]
MRLLLTLVTNEEKPVIPINYQYPLSAAIYKIIQRADMDYAAFLHDSGYAKAGSAKQFKLFTFSDIRVPFAPPFNDRLYLLRQELQVIVCFHIPYAAESFVKGLFISQHIDIADKVSKASFTIRQVEVLTTGLPEVDHPTVVLQPLSPIVTGKKNERSLYDYRNPLEADYTECLLYNWVEKYLAAYKGHHYDAADLRSQVTISVKQMARPPRERKPIIKDGTDKVSKLRGYMNFQLQVKAPYKMVELVLDAGLGLNCSVGNGCLELVKVA